MKPHFFSAACACVFALVFSMSVHAAAVSGQGTWETTLLGRDFDGNTATIEGYYDTALNITWLADANYRKTTGFDANGGQTYWAIANAWAAGLDPYGSGITGWRLPTTIDADGPDADALGNDGCNETPFFYQGLDCGMNISVLSEMSHMFYVTLGDKAQRDITGAYPQPGWGLTNTGPFSNLQSHAYWSATEYAPDTSDAWLFSFEFGSQGTGNTGAGNQYVYYAWAVHSGDVGVAITASTVPVPAAAWLFASGLLGLISVSRKRRR